MTMPTSLSGNQFPRPAVERNNIAIVLAANDGYVPYLGVAMLSIAQKGDPDFTYDFIILETKISNESKRKLARNLAPFKNTSVRFFNPSDMIAGISFHTPSYHSEETYYRIFIQTIFQHYNKLLYIDADTIVTRDIKDLYETDVTGYLMAATLDAGTVPIAVNDWGLHGVNWAGYLRDTLGMTDVYDYFQAGVLVVNVDEFKKHDVQSKSLKKMAEISPILVDQCILNSVCHGRIRKISLQWDFLGVFREEWGTAERIESLKAEDQADYIAAEKNPFLVHYAGAYPRPWVQPNIPHADLWWDVARSSVFYEELLFRGIAYKSLEMIQPAQSASALSRKMRQINYIRYKIMCGVTFGKSRQRYIQKVRKMKARLKKVS